MFSTVVYLAILEEIVIAEIDIVALLILYNMNRHNAGCLMVKLARQVHFRHPLKYCNWLKKYDDMVFFQLFRMKKATFKSLFQLIIDRDEENLIKKNTEEGIFQWHPRRLCLFSFGLWQDRIHLTHMLNGLTLYLFNAITYNS